MKSQITDLALAAKCAGRAASGLATFTAAPPTDSASNDPSASIPKPDPVCRRKFLRETAGCANRCPKSFDINKLIQTHQRLTEIRQCDVVCIFSTRRRISLFLLLEELH